VELSALSMRCVFNLHCILWFRRTYHWSE
jgi:hypothetical protein